MSETEFDSELCSFYAKSFPKIEKSETDEFATENEDQGLDGLYSLVPSLEHNLDDVGKGHLSKLKFTLHYGFGKLSPNF